MIAGDLRTPVYLAPVRSQCKQRKRERQNYCQAWKIRRAQHRTLEGSQDADQRLSVVLPLTLVVLCGVNGAELVSEMGGGVSMQLWESGIPIRIR